MTGVSQWKSTSEILTWFGNLQNFKKARFTKFDIVEFYPSISPGLLDWALLFAESVTELSTDEKENINLTKQSFGG